MFQRLIAAFCALALLGSMESRADFMGHRMTLSLNGWQQFTTVLTSGGYASAVGLAYLQYNLSGTNLTMSLACPAGQTWAGTTTFTLTDSTSSSQNISGVTIDASTTVPGFSSSNVSFDNKNVYFNLNGLPISNVCGFNGSSYYLISSQQISLNITFS
jgi:hypothetical protein